MTSRPHPVQPREAFARPRSWRIDRLALAALAALFVGGVCPAGGAAREAPAAGSSWPEIPAEEKALTKVTADPEADAVVLLKSRDSRVHRQADDYVNVTNYFWRLKVLTERGKRYGEVHIPARKYSRVDQIEARTVKLDGTVVPVPPDQIFEKVVFEIGSTKLTEKVFNFPAVEVGAILEYRYVRRDNGLLFVDPWFFAGEEYTLRSHVSQGFLAGTSYTILCDLCPSVQPAISEWRDGKEKGQLYALDLRDLPGYREERMMPPARETTPRLDMVLAAWKGQYFIDRADRFFIDWDSVAHWAESSYDRLAKDGQSALKPVVAGWVQGVTDPQEMTKAVLRHVRDDFRYIPWVTVVGGGRSIADILKDRTADNEEKAVLLAAALKSVGVESSFVLVSGKHVGSLNPKFYTLTQFTHVVVAVTGAGGARQFLDPTVSYAPSDFVPWKDSGAGALLLTANKGELLDLPVRNEVSATRYRATVTPSRDGKAAVDLEAQYTGEDGIDVREDLVPESAAGRETWVKNWIAGQRPGAVLSSFSLENLDDPSKPLILKLSFQAPGLVTVADEAMLVRGCVVSCLDANPLSRATRSHPFYIDRGWNDEETVMIQPPAGLAAGAMPPAVNARSSMAAGSFACVPYGEGGARCLRQFSARRNRWPATENGPARAMFDKMIQGDRTSVAFAPAEASAAGGGGR